MREIKFRGLTLKDKVWVYGHYCKVEGRSFIIPPDAYIVLGRSFYIDITPDDEIICMGLVEVDPETLEVVDA